MKLIKFEMNDLSLVEIDMKMVPFVKIGFLRIFVFLCVKDRIFSSTIYFAPKISSFATV